MAWIGGSKGEEVGKDSEEVCTLVFGLDLIRLRALTINHLIYMQVDSQRTRLGDTKVDKLRDSCSIGRLGRSWDLCARPNFVASQGTQFGGTKVGESMHLCSTSYLGKS